MTHTSLTNEKELLMQLAGGSQRAFKELYSFYSPRLYGKLIKLLKSAPDAEEVLQDVFLKIWELRGTIDTEKSFRSYIFKMTVNKVYDFYRKSACDKKLTQHLTRASLPGYSHIEEAMVGKENESQLYKAIDSLPPQRRKVFRLCKLDGYSYKEVSLSLGISPSTISDHIVKATHHIHHYMLLQ